MDIINWFDRKFDFGIETGEFGNLLLRLKETPPLLGQLIKDLPDALIRVKPGTKWSVMEHLGHLVILEPLWQSRFNEIGMGVETMSPADLDNLATEKAGFNNRMPDALLQDLVNVRQDTIDQLNLLDEHAFSHKSIHPRLQQPMRITDMMYFVAEHDQHHLNSISRIIQDN